MDTISVKLTMDYNKEVTAATVNKINVEQDRGEFSLAMLVEKKRRESLSRSGSLCRFRNCSIHGTML